MQFIKSKRLYKDLSHRWLESYTSSHTWRTIWLLCPWIFDFAVSSINHDDREPNRAHWKNSNIKSLVWTLSAQLDGAICDLNHSRPEHQASLSSRHFQSFFHLFLYKSCIGLLNHDNPTLSWCCTLILKHKFSIINNKSILRLRHMG